MKVIKFPQTSQNLNVIEASMLALASTARNLRTVAGLDELQSDKKLVGLLNVNADANDLQANRLKEYAENLSAELEAQHRKTWALAMDVSVETICDLLERYLWVGYAAKSVGDDELPNSLEEKPCNFVLDTHVRKFGISKLRASPCPPIEATKDK